jgi:hypothetical protein
MQVLCVFVSAGDDTLLAIECANEAVCANVRTFINIRTRSTGDLSTSDHIFPRQLLTFCTAQMMVLYRRPPVWRTFDLFRSVLYVLN